jgi:tetratricopeptide (TPR) repeat protein
MADASERYRFGSREGRSLTDLASDVAFLSWSSGHNAAVVLCALAEDLLLHENDDSASDSLDRAMLAVTLASQWSGGQKDSPVLAYSRLLRDIAGDGARRATWHQAVDRCGEGAQLHSSQPNRALELYSESLNLFESLGDEKGAGRCRGNIGLLLIDHNSVQEGVRECMAALDLHLRVHYDRGVLMHLGNVLRAAQRLERWEDGVCLSRDRVEVASRSEPSGLAAAHGDLGWFAVQMGQREDAEAAYREGVAALDHVQTPQGLKRQIDSLGPLAHALGHAADLQNDIPRLQQQISTNLHALNLQAPAPAVQIIDRFRRATETNDNDAMYQALAQSERWSSVAFERALFNNAVATLVDDQAQAQQWNALARRFALAYCRAFLNRGPFDEFALYTAWSLDQRVIKARAHASTAAAVDQATVDDRESAHVSLTAALSLHSLIGDREAFGSWFPEAFRELAVPPATRATIHRLMFTAAQESTFGGRQEERLALEALFEVASREGTTIDIADACTRLGIHHSEMQHGPETAEWFALAEQRFHALEAVGISVREETGRTHNKLKMSAHLLEFLEREGRHSEAASVGVAALREIDWFIESFGHLEYVMRAKGYKNRMLYVLARSYEQLGGYEKSLGYADRMLAWSRETGEKAAVAAAHHTVAVAQRALLKLQDAQASAQADLAIQRELGDRGEIAIAAVLCAELATDLGDTQHARELAMEAVELAGDNPKVASSRRDARYVLARLAERDGETEEAIRLYTEILAEEEAASRPGWIVTASVLAERLVRQGRVYEALAIAERAWTASQEVQSLSLRMKAGCALAFCQLATDAAAELRKAIDVLLECCRLAETIRGEMADESHKTLAAAARVQPFEMLILTLLRVVVIDPDPAWKRLLFNTAERAKARALAEAIAASAAHQAETEGFRVTGMSVRPVDPREEITRADFMMVRDMLRRETTSNCPPPQAS